ncbi:MAG: hypothetical protein AAFY91_16820, partial [Bacteroidota bacterium]
WPPGSWQEATSHLTKQESRRLRAIIEKIWRKHAADLPWGRGWLADNQAELGKVRLAEHFCYWNQSKWKTRKQELARRLVLVKRWIDGQAKKHERVVTLRLPDVYFDIRETNYFTRTKAWYERDVKRRGEIREKCLTTLLERAIAQYVESLSDEDPDKRGRVYRKWQYYLRNQQPGLEQIFEQKLLTIKATIDATSNIRTA